MNQTPNGVTCIGRSNKCVLDFARFIEKKKQMKMINLCIMRFAEIAEIGSDQMNTILTAHYGHYSGCRYDLSETK